MNKNTFRWKLSKEDLAIIRNQKKSQSEIVEIRKEDLEKHLGEKATSVIMKVNLLCPTKSLNTENPVVQ